MKRILATPKVQITLVVAAAFLVRIWLATSPALDYDEASSYAPAALSYLNGDWSANFPHPMVVKLLFAGSVVLFGQHGWFGTLFPWLPESIGAVRLVSAIIGAAICFVMYELAKEVSGSQHLGMVAGALLAFDPVSVGESSYGLLDPGMTLFYMISILFFYRFVKGGRALEFYVSAVSFGLAVASKYYAIIAFPILIGILLWKHKFRAEWKSMAVYLGVSIIVFFAVQPVLWTSPLVNLSHTLINNQHNLLRGHLVKVPGSPFLVPPTRMLGGPWLYIGANPFASKPDFYADPSNAVQSPWWYLIYIQTMYSTPFEIVVYPVTICYVILNGVRRRLTDLTTLSGLLVSAPVFFFAALSVRLPQYALLPSTSAAMLGAVAFDGLSGRRRTMFILFLFVFHVGWTLYALLTAGNNFTGWSFDETILTPILANIFGLLWKLTQGFHW
ncbi:MAG TPA: glycosyltransferase family 39 protein [Candidatus Bathyarchaeia archaeon]|nr:glycosyltransferase family 39 protein [Candidatus Bathyarchaeia archaeon]